MKLIYFQMLVTENTNLLNYKLQNNLLLFILQTTFI